MSEIDIDDAELAAMMAEIEGEPASLKSIKPKAEPEAAAQPEEPAFEPDPEPVATAQTCEMTVKEVPNDPPPVITATSEGVIETPAETIAVVKADDTETKTKSFVDVDQLKKDVRINPNNLDQDMIQHPSMYVHYSVQTVNARRQYDRIKNAFDILASRLDAEYRETLAAEGKKVTEAMIANAVKADARWRSGQSQVIDAQSTWKLAEIAENAFHQRKDMLLELARDRRKEKEGQLRVLEQQNQRDAVIEMMRAKNH